MTTALGLKLVRSPPLDLKSTPARVVYTLVSEYKLGGGLFIDEKIDLLLVSRLNQQPKLKLHSAWLLNGTFRKGAC